MKTLTGFVAQLLALVFSIGAAALGQNLPGDCAHSGGKWLGEYQECEYTSHEWCESAGGDFEECMSVCRHSSQPLGPCTMQCVPVCKFQQNSKLPEAKGPQDSTYLIEGRPVKFENGEAKESNLVSASTIDSKITLAGSGGDLGGHGSGDVPVVIVRNTGGSGSFYYVAAAIGTSGTAFHGTNAIMFGDRILPKGVEIRNKAIIVNYTDRYPWESFVVTPSVARSRTFDVEHDQLRETPFAVLADSVARDLVIAKWGDCQPNTCKQLNVKVLDGGGGAWYVEATYEGEMDDFTSGQRKIAPAFYREGSWAIEDVLVEQFRCRPGKGHEDFSAEPCR